MQNYFQSQQKRAFNPVVEAMNNNYQNLYQNFDQSTNYDNVANLKNYNQSNNQSENQSQKIASNQNYDNSNQINNQNFDSNQSNNNLNLNNLAGMLGQMGSNNNYMDIIKAISGNNMQDNKQGLILNLLSNLNTNKANIQNKKTTQTSSDFSNLTSIEDYNFID